LLNQSGDQGALAKLKDANQISSGLLSTDEHYFSSVVEQVFGFVPAWLPPLEAIYRSLTSLYSEPFRKHYLKENPIDAFCNSLNQDRINRIEPVHASMYSMCKASLPNYVFTNLGDRMEMAHSLEGRLPFLDHKVAEILFSVPASMKIKGETEKYILREAVKPYLLQDIYTREKHPFLTPPSILNPKDKFHQLVQDTLRGPIINDIPFLSQANILDLLANLDNISIDEWGKTEACLMEMMSLAAIQHEFGVRG
jgi:asparagine synthase (glutamine-hydrolysing)